MRLTNKTILITGGSGGIGLETALQLYRKGNTVIITGRSASKLAEAKKQESGLITIQSDVSNLDDIYKLFAKVSQEYPSLDILINNAGIMRKINLHQANTDLDTLTEEISTNLVATIRMSTIFLPLLKEKRAAAIVNTTSGLAFVPLPICPVYGATKAGLHSFTESLRMQLQYTNIKVIEVAPPQTKTDLEKSFENQGVSGTPVMSAADVAAATCKAIEREQGLALIGLARVLYWMGRIAPGLILKQISKGTVPQMLQSSAPSSLKGAK